MKEIELQDIEQFSKIYNSNVNNKNIEKRIKQYGLDKVCINPKVIDENPPFFNIELEETKRYDQKDSLRCWAFSGINVIKRNMADNLNMDIENFVFISNVPKRNRKYGEKLKNLESININKMKYVEFLHISAQELKELSIKQLKDHIPVMVGIYIRKFADKKSGVLDTRLYDYENLIKYKNLNKEAGMLLGDIELHHWMTITGVQIEEGVSKRWKVEDTYGDKEKVNGYYIMNDNYFDKYVFTVIINKKYLSKKQLELYNQKGIIEKN